MFFFSHRYFRKRRKNLVRERSDITARAANYCILLADTFVAILDKKEIPDDNDRV